jgi:t-SNARE complex subunit (syntaxin)
MGRTEKVSKVANSLLKIHKMYENLNMIVAEQGETLTRLEDNVCYTKHTTKKAVEELKGALSNEKSIRD